MKANKILIVTKFFYPEITPRAFRAFELAKEFSNQGHEVTVLTTVKKCSYVTLEAKYGFKVKDIVKNEPSELQGNGIKRIVRFALLHIFQYPYIFLSSNFKNALNKENGYDLLISIAHPFPVHFGVALARGKNKSLAKTWVADCGDPFAGNQHGRLPYPFYYKWLENWFCKRVDFITIPIKEALPAYPEFCRDKIRVIPQGFNFAEVKPSYKKENNKVPTFAYAGNTSPGLRDPRLLLDFLNNTKKDFKFIIYTRNTEFLKPYQLKLGAKLELRDYVPRNKLINELGTMDFLLNLENKGSVQKPSKLIDYALLKRPILSILPANLDKEKIVAFLDGDYTKALKIDNLESYSILNVTKEFLKLR